MLIQTPKYYEVAIDGIQIFLCLLILIFLIRNRVKHNRIATQGLKGDAAADFNMEVCIQAIRQYVERAFSNIIETATAERHNLEQMLQVGQIRAENFSAFGMPTLPGIPIQRGNACASKGFSSADDWYFQIEKLAAEGMNVQQISEELEIPKGEVELILSLKKGGN